MQTATVAAVPLAPKTDFSTQIRVTMKAGTVEVSNAGPAVLKQILSVLSNATGFEKVYVACGQTDLRLGIEILVTNQNYAHMFIPHGNQTEEQFCFLVVQLRIPKIVNHHDC